VLAELGAAVAALPQPSDIDASDSYDEAGAGTSAAALLARLPRCPDLSGLDAVTLTRAVVLPAMAAWHAAVQAGASSTTSAPGNSKHLVDGALSPMVPGGLSPPPASFPKLWALVQFVRQYRYVGLLMKMMRCAVRNQWQNGVAAAVLLGFMVTRCDFLPLSWTGIPNHTVCPRDRDVFHGIIFSRTRQVRGREVRLACFCDRHYWCWKQEVPMDVDYQS
jgi:hypothetical protein